MTCARVADPFPAYTWQALALFEWEGFGCWVKSKRRPAGSVAQLTLLNLPPEPAYFRPTKPCSVSVEGYAQAGWTGWGC